MAHAGFASATSGRGFEGAIARLFEDWRQARALSRTIRELRALDDAALADIGLARDDIEGAARAALARRS